MSHPRPGQPLHTKLTPFVRRTARLATAIDVCDILTPKWPPCTTTFTDLLPFALEITLADETREAEEAMVAAATASASSSKGARASPFIAEMGWSKSSRRSTRLQGLAPYKHKIDWTKEERVMVKALGRLE